MPVSDNEIYDEMTAAFRNECRRGLTQAAEHGLREFIRVSVINGHHMDPNLYPMCREYLKCRFETIADFLNAGSGDVTWTQLIDRGSAEVRVGKESPCAALLPPEYRAYVRRMKERSDTVDDSGPDGVASVVERALRLCVGYAREDIQPPPGGID
jgi:hypothetical protein